MGDAAAGDPAVGDAFVDTDVLVYAVDADEPAKRARAAALLADLAGRITISTQVLTEYYVTVTRKLARPQPAEQAEQAVRALARLPVVDVDHDLVLTAVALSRSAQVSLEDAAIVTAAQWAGCTRLYSEDLNDGQVFDGVVVVDPFRPAAGGAAPTGG